MEDSQLSVESFSHTWLVNQDTSLCSSNRSFRFSFDATDSASFIEMDPNLTPSKRFLVHQDLDLDLDFDFDVPIKSQSHVTLVDHAIKSQSHVTLVDHADKLISNGILVPLKSSSSSINIHVSPLSSSSSSTGGEGRLRKSGSMIMSLCKCHKLQKRMMEKYMDLVKPLWCRIMGRGNSDSSRVLRGVDNWESGGSKAGGACWGGRCDSESSIHEAVVHCKKTIGMDY